MFGRKSKKQVPAPSYGMTLDMKNNFSITGDQRAAFEWLKEHFQEGNGKEAKYRSTPGYAIGLLPEGVIIKRIFARKGVNKWLVRYHNKKTEYYGPTLTEALQWFFRCQPEVYARYMENVNSVERSKNGQTT